MNPEIASTLLIAVIGWLISLILQRKNLADQTRTKIIYDIYKQISILHQEMQDALSRVNSSAYPSFIMMEGYLIGKPQQQGIVDGYKRWTDDTWKAITRKHEFDDKWIKFLYLIEDWGGPLRPLQKAQEELITTVTNKRDELNKLLSDWQIISTKRGHDWTKWNRAEIEKEGEVIRKIILDIQCYLADFIILVHNQLMSSYFNHSRKTRVPQDEKYKILTHDGIILTTEYLKRNRSLLKNIHENFVSNEDRVFKYKLGNSIGSALSGLITGIILASIIWLAIVYYTRLFLPTP